MTKGLRTLEDFDIETYEFEQSAGTFSETKSEVRETTLIFKSNEYVQRERMRNEAINWLRNLQSSNTYSSIVLDSLPEDMRGSIAKDKWSDTVFRYGAEYGMLAWIKHFFNITNEDLK